MLQLTATRSAICSLACLTALVVPQSALAAHPEAGVRIDVPEANVALTIPNGWSVTVEHRRADPPPGESMPADERWFVLSALADSDELNGCRLFRYETSGTTLEEFGTELLGVQPLNMTPVLLDSGEAVGRRRHLEGPEIAQQYVLGSGETFYQLACIKDEEPPDDRWLSIAGSIEYLPAGE